MSYYTAQFGYRGLKMNIPHDGPEADEACKALDRAIDAVIDALDALGLDHSYQHVWPDGSLYRTIRSDLAQAVLEEKLRTIETPDVRFIHIYPAGESDWREERRGR